jgi:hypothetical protein
MANEDYFTGVTLNKDLTLNNLQRAFELYKNYDQYQYNDDALYVISKNMT